jgi:hypothetical protein
MEIISREDFVSEKDQIMSKLNELLEKMIQIETVLRTALEPPSTSSSEERPKKKMRKE